MLPQVSAQTIEEVQSFLNDFNPDENLEDKFFAKLDSMAKTNPELSEMLGSIFVDGQYGDYAEFIHYALGMMDMYILLEAQAAVNEVKL